MGGETGVVLSAQNTEGNSVKLVCPETQRNCNFCCIGVLNYCPSSPEFEVEHLKHEPRLLNLVDSTNEEGAAAVDKKFGDLHEDLQKRHVNPFLWTVPIVILGIGAIFGGQYLRRIYQVQCLTNNVCSPPENLSMIGSGQCPDTTDWLIECCYAFCSVPEHTPSDKLKKSSNNLTEKPIILNEDSGESIFFDNESDDNCFFDQRKNEKIKENAKIGPGCHCVEQNWMEYPRKGKPYQERRIVCGEVKMYGDVQHFPGYFAAPKPTRTLQTAGFFMVVLSLFFRYFYGCCRTRKMDDIIYRHFEDWNAKGINVIYQPPQKDGCNKDPGRITLILPQHPASYPFNQATGSYAPPVPTIPYPVNQTTSFYGAAYTPVQSNAQVPQYQDTRNDGGFAGGFTNPPLV